MNYERIGILCTLGGLVIAFFSYRQGCNKNIKDDAKEDATDHTMVTTKLEYISRGIDDIRLDNKQRDREMKDMSERVTRVEESSKSAHKRLDDIGKEV